MKYINYDVKNMAISPSQGEKTKLISGAVNFFGVHFNFDDEFSAIPGGKAVEFFKNKQTRRVDLVENQCAIPNELLTDKASFEMRVVSGNTIGTTWLSVGITESGIIMPEEPEEEAPVMMAYVKTPSGEYEVALIRATTNGLEYSTDGGETWNSGVSGVPEVPARPKDVAYLRKNGDWVNAKEYLAENGGEANIIDEIQVDGTALPVTDKTVNIDLSAYAKTSDIDALQTMTGTAETVSDIEYTVTDISDVISAYNTLLSALRSRGVIA